MFLYFFFHDFIWLCCSVVYSRNVFHVFNYDNSTNASGSLYLKLCYNLLKELSVWTLLSVSSYAPGLKCNFNYSIHINASCIESQPTGCVAPDNLTLHL